MSASKGVGSGCSVRWIIEILDSGALEMFAGQNQAETADTTKNAPEDRGVLH
ncbi:hypothetical protein ACFSE0_12050 [Ochrobactrum teleogrylli]|uniref:hypothetical protein n=1 Tax=Ochrobactrum teleogrylli TaxID=2479765 RepID=UPI0015DE53AF|nr:hypothetical protein [[Ochrobactrum] teleogrylli]